MENLYPVFMFVVDNYGHGEKTEIWIVAKDYEQAFECLEEQDRNIDYDYSDKYMSSTGYYMEVKNPEENLPFVDRE